MSEMCTLEELRKMIEEAIKNKDFDTVRMLKGLEQVILSKIFPYKKIKS